mmetsp:Transcript_6799/g.12945  ORF Transcript_6799/g.12945 Transcript_6799/m.12945 type:complete len:253 (-) Transcript_6799:185-943(-)
MAQAAELSQVLIFGDSWAAYPLVPKTWPMQLADRFGVRALNFAVPGSRSDQLMDQFGSLLISPEAARTATGEIDPHSLAVIHTAGNDFMQRLGADFMKHLPGEAEADAIRNLMKNLYETGVRQFVVADVPFAPCVPGVRMAAPIIQSMVSAGNLEHLGVEPHDSAELAVQLQATALHDQWADMLACFQKEHPDSTVVHFDEPFVLSRLRDTVGASEFDKNFFDMTLIHPSAYGHTLLAQEACKCMQEVSCAS